MSRSESSRMIDRLADVLERHKLNVRGAVFILGASGGPDSMVLCSLFRQIQKKVVVAHINYQKRPESAGEADMIRDYCLKYDLPFEYRTADARKAAGNFQNWARNERRSFFHHLMKVHGAAAIVTAHHRDDQLETIMQKLLRGSALTSLQGLQEFDGRYLRPLLGFSKAEILDYAGKNGIPYSLDLSNLESGYARNFIRNEWIPHLDKLFPGWRTNILRMADRAVEYRLALHEILDQTSDGPEAFRREALLKLDSVLIKPLILEKARLLFPDLEFSAGSLKDFNPETLQTGKSAQLTREISIMRSRDRFVLLKTPAEADFSRIIRIQELEQQPLQLEGCRFFLAPFQKTGRPDRLYLNLEKIPSEMIFRSWKAGDRFTPFGMKGSKKISDYLTEKKVPSEQKKRSGVLVSFDGNICAVIFPHLWKNTTPGIIDHGFKCEFNNQKSLVIERTDGVGQT